jgi:secreted Zn-dependent insulinase-like peptidase
MQKYIAAALVLLVVSGCATPPSQAPDSIAASVPAEVVEVHKSPNDPRDYRYLVLDNRMRVLLISDLETDKAAASLVVLRGQYHDPEEYLGLAHFLEHMLFIGTEKYPQLDGYQTFITRHGGSSNAYTAADHTNYFFDIQPEKFHEGLDRFSQFFISPLFDAQYVDREKNAVNSEYQLQVKDDGWRGSAVARAVLNPDHPASTFHIGSLESLGEGVREALLEFFETEYSSDQMILVALTNESLDDMEAWIKPMFNAIEDRNAGDAPEQPPLFKPGDLPSVLQYKPLKETRTVTYNFPVPSTTDHYRSKPAAYLSNLLGHEGEGSLHRYLKTAGLIEVLSAGAGRFDSDTSIINVDISLTQEGAAQIDHITDALFSYIELLKNSQVDRWRYAEQATVAELAFRFQEKPSPLRLAYGLAPTLDLYPPQDVLQAGYLMEEFNENLIREYLAMLSPDNLFMEVVSQDVETDKVEKWFQVPYHIERKRVDVDTSLTGLFDLPQPNPFLPDDLALLETSDVKPALAHQSDVSTVWLKTDTEFGAPRSNLYLTLSIPDGIKDARETVLATLFQKYLTDDLTVLTYPAFLAGLSYQVVVVPSGFRVVTNGYSDKQNILLNEVLKAYHGVDPDQERFDRFHAEMMRVWQNAANDRPYTQTNAALSQLLVSSVHPPATLASILAGLTLADLRRFQHERLHSHSALGLMHGNVDETSVREMLSTVDAHLSLSEVPLTLPRVEKIDRGLRYEVPVDHQDASMVLYVQNDEPGVEATARSSFAVQLIRAPYFTSLRTNQQLGYVVAATSRSFRDQGGVAFIVQSPVASPQALEAATRSFVQGQVAAIEAMPEDEFEGARQGLISRLTEKDKSLAARTQRYWSDIDLQAFEFDTRARSAEAVAALTRADMVEYIRTLGNKMRTARLIVYNSGKFDASPVDGDLINDIEAFKRH